MRIELEWVGPIRLKEQKTAGYSFETIEDQLETRPAIYVFARQFGKSYSPIYIGQAANAWSRLRTQFNNLKLMERVKHWNPKDPTDPALKINGARVLFIGYLTQPKTATRTGAALKIAERALIEHALTEGHAIVNIQMTKSKYDEITSYGVKASASFSPRAMLVKAQKRSAAAKSAA